MGDREAAPPGLPNGTPKALVDTVACTAASISWKPGDTIDWLPEPVPTISIKDISPRPTGEIAVTGEAWDGVLSLSLTLSVTGGNLTVQLSGFGDFVSADAAGSWIDDLNHWLAANNKKLEAPSYDRRTHAVTFTKVTLTTPGQGPPPKADAKPGVAAPSQEAPVAGASGSTRLEGPSRAKTADALSHPDPSGEAQATSHQGPPGFSRLDEIDPWGAAQRHPLPEKLPEEASRSLPARRIEGPSRAKTSDAVVQASGALMAGEAIGVRQRAPWYKDKLRVRFWRPHVELVPAYERVVVPVEELGAPRVVRNTVMVEPAFLTSPIDDDEPDDDDDSGDWDDDEDLAWGCATAVWKALLALIVALVAAGIILAAAGAFSGSTTPISRATISSSQQGGLRTSRGGSLPTLFDRQLRFSSLGGAGISPSSYIVTLRPGSLPGGFVETDVYPATDGQQVLTESFSAGGVEVSALENASPSGTSSFHFATPLPLLRAPYVVGTSWSATSTGTSSSGTDSVQVMDRVIGIRNLTVAGMSLGVVQISIHHVITETVENGTVNQVSTGTEDFSPTLGVFILGRSTEVTGGRSTTNQFQLQSIGSPGTGSGSTSPP